MIERLPSAARLVTGMRESTAPSGESRRAARTTATGDLVLLEDQDRSLWNAEQIAQGSALVEKALSSRRVGVYTVQAAIAAVHCEANTADETDWPQIVALYEELMRFSSSPVIALNHAAAVAMAEGAENGLRRIDAAGASGTLDTYYLFHAARADLLRRLNRFSEARAAYERALTLTTNLIEQNYIRRRLDETSTVH